MCNTVTTTELLKICPLCWTRMLEKRVDRQPVRKSVGTRPLQDAERAHLWSEPSRAVTTKNLPSLKEQAWRALRK